MLSIALALLAPLSAPSAGPQTPCVEISRPADRPTERRDFTNTLTIGMFQVRVLEGKSNCVFDEGNVGRCTLSDPRIVVVNTGRDDVWYGIPAGQPVDVSVSHGTYTCMVGRTVRTD